MERQYTGFKDKNGKEIYEGDIFKYWYELDANVEGGTTNHYGVAVCEWVDDGFYILGNSLNDFLNADENYQLIGNIYENKNLLK